MKKSTAVIWTITFLIIFIGVFFPFSANNTYFFSEKEPAQLIETTSLFKSVQQNIINSNALIYGPVHAATSRWHAISSGMGSEPVKPQEPIGVQHTAGSMIHETSSNWHTGSSDTHSSGSHVHNKASDTHYVESNNHIASTNVHMATSATISHGTASSVHIGTSLEHKDASSIHHASSAEHCPASTVHNPTATNIRAPVNSISHPQTLIR